MEQMAFDIEISSITYKFTSMPSGYEMKYLTEIEGDIFANDADGIEYLAGKVKYVFINADEAIDDGFSPEELLDLQSNTAHFMGNIYNKKGYCFRRKILNLYNHAIFSSNLLILDRIELLPAYRGRNWFTEILDDGIRHFGFRADLIALKAFPLQFEANSQSENIIEWRNKMAIKLLSQDEKKSFRRLESYYKKFGFIKVSNYGIMVRTLGYHF